MQNPLKLPDISAAGILLCAMVLTAVVIRREFFASPRETPVRFVGASPAATLVGHVLGDNTAPVTMVVFGDFQCEFCAKAHSAIDTLLKKYPSQIKVRYRHLPLEALHPHAWTAALAAECAGDQNRFRPYHDLLYALQDSIGIISWTVLAQRAGVVNLDTFHECVRDERHTNAVQRDVLLARSLHLRGTPAVIIGNEMLEGLPSMSWMDDRVRAEAKKVANLGSQRTN